MFFELDDLFEIFQITIRHVSIVVLDGNSEIGLQEFGFFDFSKIEVFEFLLVLEVFLEVFLVEGSSSNSPVEVIIPKPAVIDAISDTIAETPVCVTTNSKSFRSRIAACRISGTTSLGEAAVGACLTFSSSLGPMTRWGATCVFW